MAGERRPVGQIGQPAARVSGVRSIAVLRSGGLGDLVFALPALDALRAAYPEARIVLLGTAWQRDLLLSRPSPVDDVVALPPVPGVTAPPDAPVEEDALAAAVDALCDERFDIAVQLHGGGRHSNPFLTRLRARVTAGLRTPDAAALDRTVRYVYYQSEVLRALEVVGLVGAVPIGIEPRLEVTESDRNAAQAVLGDPRSPLVVFHPGAGDSRRRWPAASFAALGDALSRRGATVAVTGSGDESRLVRAVIEAMEARALDLRGRLDLGGLAGVLAAADLVVSNDSGPLHLAMAVGTATIGVYWCGNLINAGPFGRGRHRPAISWQLDCPVCGVDCTRAACVHRESFVARVTVDEVLASAVDLLEVAPIESPAIGSASGDAGCRGSAPLDSAAVDSAAGVPRAAAAVGRRG